MNCANHTERTATAFCQNCGKPICEECSRKGDGLVLCEPCWVARLADARPGPPASPLGSQPGAGTSGWTQVPGHAVPYAASTAGYRPAYAQPPAPFASPVLAGFLGFIPGVGAMYNGQFIKALLHVVIFIVLIGATEHFDLAGILIPAWIFYQVFDAAHTASARRDGRPLPDPLGILDLSQRLGPQTPPQSVAQGTPYPPHTPAPAAPPPPGDTYPPYQSSVAAGTSTAYSAAPNPGNPYPGPVYGTPGQTGGYAPIPQAAYAPPAIPARPGEPVGAIVLIVVGLLFLLSTMHVFDFDWITRGWPILLLILGGWLLWRRARPDPSMPAIPSAPPPRAGGWAVPSTPGTGPRNSGTALERSPLSILPREQHAHPHSDTQPESGGSPADHRADQKEEAE